MLYCSPTNGWIIMSKLVRLLVNSLCVFSMRTVDCRLYDLGLQIEKSEILLHKSCILMMSSADILMVCVWVLSSRDLGARCPTFSGPPVPRSHVTVCQARSSFTCAADIDMWVSGPRYLSVMCSKLNGVSRKDLSSGYLLEYSIQSPLVTWRQFITDRLLIAKMNLHKTKHIFATCLSVSDWCVNTLYWP